MITVTMCRKAGSAAKKSEGKRSTTEAEASIEYYEARSTVTGPCGHKHKTREMAEKCARSFAANYRRKNPNNVHTYWHVASVDRNGIRRRAGDDV